MILDALSKGLITSFIDQSSYSEDIYQTKLVQNNYPLEKVINTFEGELELMCVDKNGGFRLGGF